MAKRILPVILVLGFLLAPLSAFAQEGEPETPEAPLAWTRSAFAGISVPSNDTVWSLAEYKGYLYAGTRNPTIGAQVWRTNTGVNWWQVQFAGMGDPHNTAIPVMHVGDDYLYLGTQNNQDGAEVWRTNGTSWLQINSNGFGNPNNDVAWSMNGHYTGSPWVYHVYVGTLNSADGANLWDYDQSSWTPRTIDGIANIHNENITSMQPLGLYVGTWNAATGSQVWTYSAAFGWTDLNANGFWDVHNIAARSMLYTDDFLYVGTFNSANGAQIWRYDLGAHTWARVANNGFGDSHNVGVSSLFAYGEHIYAGTENTATGAEVWRSRDGLTWEQVNVDGFGTPNNQEAVSMAGFGPYLFVGTRNFASGAEIWRVNLLSTDQSFLVNSQNKNLEAGDVVYNNQGRQYLALWTGENPGQYDDEIGGQRLFWDGQLTGSPINIASGAGAERCCARAAYDSDNNRFLVIWYQNAGGVESIHGRVFSGSGNPVSNEFEVTGVQEITGYDVSYAPVADHYLVTYSYSNSTTHQSALVAQPVTAGGVLDGSLVQVRSTTNAPIDSPSMVFHPDFDQLLVVWSERVAGNQRDIYGRRLYYPGNFATLNPAFVISNGTSSDVDTGPDVGILPLSGYGPYMVAWTHANGSLWQEAVIQTRRVSGDGIPQGSPVGISNMLESGSLHSGVIGLPLSQRYQVVWFRGIPWYYSSSLLSRQVSSAGAPLGSQGWIAGAWAFRHAEAHGPGDTYLVFYDDIPMGSLYRQVRGRVFGLQHIYLPLIRR